MTQKTAQLDPKLLEMLVCPVSKTALRFDAEKSELISDAAGLAFPVRDSIPIMLVDEARPLHEEASSLPSEIKSDA